MDYVIYGAGAVGGTIGARLSLAGRAVTLVARGEHLARIRADGLILDAPDGMHTVRIPATDGVAGIGWTADTVVLLAVKSQQTDAVLADLVAHAPEGTPLVCAQNGVANERAALRLFPNVHGLTMMFPTGHLAPGTVVQASSPVPGLLDVGRYPSGVDAVDEAVAADLRAAGFDSTADPDVMARKYRKLLLNLANAVDALTGYDGPDGAELLRLAMDEGEAVLACAGIVARTPDDDDARRAAQMQVRTDGAAPGGGSTWQSVTRGQDTESDWLAGEIVLLARLHGRTAPVNALLQRRMRTLARAGGAPRSIPAAELLAELSAGAPAQP